MNCKNWPPEFAVQKGFGLLEALVALVLLSSVGFTLLAWVEQNLDTAQRLRAHYQEQDARRRALDWLRAVNPMETPEGEAKRDDVRFAWKATPVGPVVAQAGYPAGTGRYEVALYETTITVYRTQEQTPWFSEKLTMIGYRKAISGSQLVPNVR